MTEVLTALELGTSSKYLMWQRISFFRGTVKSRNQDFFTFLSRNLVLEICIPILSFFFIYFKTRTRSGLLIVNLHS